MNKICTADKLALNKFEVDEGMPHIIVNNELCGTCRNKQCLDSCPAGLYSESNGEIVVEWAGCLECGTCRAVCDRNALMWKYPRGGFGIVYRQG